MSKEQGEAETLKFRSDRKRTSTASSAGNSPSRN